MAEASGDRSQIDVVLFSGGSGTDSIARALLKHPQIRLRVLINAYDDGHSTGRLRRFIPGMLGPSDVRKNVNRLMPSRERCHQALKKVTRVTAEKRKLMHSIADYFLIWACCREAEIQSAA